MTTTRRKAAAATRYDAAATYSVRLTRPVEVPGGVLIPTHAHRIKGRVLETIPADAVASAELRDTSRLADV